MGYKVTQVVISKEHALYPYCMAYAKEAKLLYNAALFRIRNIFTGYEKEVRTSNEREVFQEIALLNQRYPSMHVRKVISYFHLEKLMRVTNNPDFFRSLSKQMAQQILKLAVADFKKWLASLKKYKKSPVRFLGRPRMPHYKRSDMATFILTNQDCVLYPKENGMELKLPLTKIRVSLSHLSEDAVLKEVQIKPYYGRFLLCIIMEEPDTELSSDLPNLCAIDFGTDNFATIVCTDHSSKLYKGGAMLSKIQWFHKERARLIGILTKGHKNKRASSKRLIDLSYHHANFVKDQ